MEIDIELTKKYRVMVYPYVHEKEHISGREDRYRQYHSDSLWEYDGFDHEDYEKIVDFLKDLEFQKTLEIEKRQEKELKKSTKEVEEDG